jgi:hypothetical protein
MRTRNFHLNIEQFTDNEVVIRLRAYVRHRFGHGPLPVKGRAERDREYACIVARAKTGRTWPRTR